MHVLSTASLVLGFFLLCVASVIVHRIDQYTFTNYETYADLKQVIFEKYNFHSMNDVVFEFNRGDNEKPAKKTGKFPFKLVGSSAKVASFEDFATCVRVKNYVFRVVMMDFSFTLQVPKAEKHLSISYILKQNPTWSDALKSKVKSSYSLAGIYREDSTWPLTPTMNGIDFFDAVNMPLEDVALYGGILVLIPTYSKITDVMDRMRQFYKNEYYPRPSTLLFNAVVSATKAGGYTIKITQRTTDVESTTNRVDSGFTPEVKDACWERATSIPSRDPSRWKYDAYGNPVCRKMNHCYGGCTCYQYDHIRPHKLGNPSTVDNCQLLQARINNKKRDKVLFTNEQLKGFGCSRKPSSFEMDIIELSLYGDIIRPAGASCQEFVPSSMMEWPKCVVQLHENTAVIAQRPRVRL